MEVVRHEEDREVELVEKLLQLEPEPRTRVRIECRQWLVEEEHTGLARELCYGTIYPQIFPNMHRATDEAQAQALDWARPLARRWLDILDESLLGPSRAFLGGSEPCLADYTGVAMVTAGEDTIVEVLTIADGDEITTCCGGCRQRLAEFADSSTPVHAAGPDGVRRSFTLGELLPAAFGPQHLPPP